MPGEQSVSPGNRRAGGHLMICEKIEHNRRPSSGVESDKAGHIIGEKGKLTPMAVELMAWREALTLQDVKQLCGDFNNDFYRSGFKCRSRALHVFFRAGGL